MQEQDSRQEDQEPSSPPLSPLKPGKGKLILLLGLLSVLGFPIYFFMLWLAIELLGDIGPSSLLGIVAVIIMPGFLLGLIATIMGYRELNRIRKGLTEPSKRKSANAGFILGALGCTLVPLGVWVFLSLMASGAISSSRDAMIVDLLDLSANAYQYRTRPASKGGGEGAYTGYVIPAHLASNENGAYAAIVLHPDTIQFHTKSTRDTSWTITVTIGPDGKAIAESWKYSGEFE